MGFSSSGGAKVGTIEMWGGDTAPDGYLICDGGAISRTVYKDLFDAIGTTYGAGDETTTFNLPNFATGKIITDNIAIVGTGKGLGITDGQNSGTMNFRGGTSPWAGLSFDGTNVYNNVGASVGGKYPDTDNTMGVVKDPTKSGLTSDLSSNQSVTYIIKY